MKKLCFVAYFCIVLILTFMCKITYSYFNTTITGESKEINVSTLSEDVNIEYKDTSNLSLVNAYTGDKILKTFTVNNKGSLDVYYNVNLENVVNNLEDRTDLVYRITSSNDIIVKDKPLPIEDSIILSNILIKPGEEHVYNLEVEFLKKETDQSLNMNKTFSSNIKITSGDVILGDKLYKDGSLIKMISDNSLGNEKLLMTEKKDGIYSTNSSINGSSIYFYYGSNKLNNNIVLNDICYKIIRTTEEGGVRIIYSGEYINGECTSSINKIVEHNFNDNFDNNAYVGFMYGNPSSSTYELEHSNINSSATKILLDSWYSTNVSSSEDLISKDTIYCNDRTLNSFIYNGVSYGNLGYSKNNSGYNFMNYLLNNKELINFDCERIDDRFSLDSKLGNNKLTNSIGLISANEIIYSGYLDSKDNYLSSNYSFWTLTPAYFNVNGSYNFIAGNNKLTPVLVNTKSYVRPVLTLNKNVKIISGNGELSDPYMLGF